MVPPGRLWRGQDSNLRRQSQCVYSASPLTAREPRQGSASVPSRASATPASTARARPRRPRTSAGPRGCTGERGSARSHAEARSCRRGGALSARESPRPGRELRSWRIRGCHTHLWRHDRSEAAATGQPTGAPAVRQAANPPRKPHEPPMAYWLAEHTFGPRRRPYSSRSIRRTSSATSGSVPAP